MSLLSFVRPRARSWLIRLGIAIVVLVVLIGAGVLTLFLSTPSVSDAPKRVAAILAAHGAPSDKGVIPAKVAAALLATEDSRYYRNQGIDLRGALRGTWGFVTSNPNAGGANIEVQLAKLLYTPGRSGPLASLEQGVLAVKLDRAFSKKQILAMYLDAAYFGDGAYGVTAAAARYFGLPPDHLSWAQATLLAGLVQAPSAYDPHHHLSTALRRRRHVLDRLVAVGTITSSQAAAIQAAPLNPVVSFSG